MGFEMRGGGLIRDYAGSDWTLATLCSMFARRKWMPYCSECRPKLALVLQVYPVVMLSTSPLPSSCHNEPK